MAIKFGSVILFLLLCIAFPEGPGTINPFLHLTAKHKSMAQANQAPRVAGWTSTQGHFNQKLGLKLLIENMARRWPL